MAPRCTLMGHQWSGLPSSVAVEHREDYAMCLDCGRIAKVADVAKPPAGRCVTYAADPPNLTALAQPLTDPDA